MEKSQNTSEKKSIYREMPFICSKCGPFVKVYVENYMSGSENMSHIDFVHHVDFEPHLAYRLQIEKPSDGQIFSIVFCAQCSSVLNDKKKKHDEWGKNFIKENKNDSIL